MGQCFILVYAKLYDVVESHQILGYSNRAVSRALPYKLMGHDSNLAHSYVCEICFLMESSMTICRGCKFSSVPRLYSLKFK